jgi:hypothetical protein
MPKAVGATLRRGDGPGLAGYPSGSGWTWGSVGDKNGICRMADVLIAMQSHDVGCQWGAK